MGSQSLVELREQCTPSGGDERLRFASVTFGRKDVFPEVYTVARFREKSGALPCVLTSNYLPMWRSALSLNGFGPARALGGSPRRSLQSRAG